MKIHLASDHAGFETKNKIKEELIKEGYEVFDHGANTLDNNDDYPDFIFACAEALMKDLNDNEKSFGIILGGSGQGEAICANKVNGIRAIEYYGYDIDIITMSREHNDANVLSIGERFVNYTEIIYAIKKFLEVPFSDEERHNRRINKIKKYEGNK